MPVGAPSFKECLRWCAEVFHALAAILKERGLATSVGDEGGFAPALKSDEEAIETILEAVKRAGYEPGKDFKIAMDAASSEWKSEKGKGYYKLPKAGTEYTAEQLIEHWEALCEKYPIISIEDGLDEEDWEGWQKLTARLGGKVQLVGDDLFVTNTERLAKGIELGAGNAIAIIFCAIFLIIHPPLLYRTSSRDGEHMPSLAKLIHNRNLLDLIPIFAVSH